MSKILKELTDATKITAKRGEDRQDFLRRVAKAVNELPDKEFNALSEEADAWVNKAFDAMEAKRDVVDFPDLEAAEEPAGRSRRRGGAEEPAKTEGTAAYEPKLGDIVSAVMKRGKGEFVGEIVELDKDEIVLDIDGKDEVLQRSRIETIGLFDATPDAGAADGEPEDPIKVGAVVTATTKRDKVYTGEIVELSETEIVLDIDGKDEVLQRSRIASIKAAAAKEEPKATGRRGAKPAEEAPAEGKNRRASGKGEGGVALGTRIRELSIEGYKDDGKLPTNDKLKKLLEKEGYEVKDNTLSLNMAEVTKMFKLLEDADLLK